MGTATLLSVQVIDEVENNQQILKTDNAVQINFKKLQNYLMQ